ncbi:NAD(P)H-hydrate dehydratase [Novosphingobium sp. B1]|uniref:NAD(P)H-hydrate dehydratase n=1 Tax=Novosphingobium sp. B1 TaxID=1938756 RepID=UPI0009D8E414|nr:NAD(P)H-hydrate dehydratase [Novosphingobium sp. B1]SMC79004.1 yjeF C-terminal region, hydroxyethylthiazole kinase-related [Novosphingobium sp. B1]
MSPTAWLLPVAEARTLDGAWLRKHPLPQPHEESDKNARGRVLVVGGCTMVPGGVRLTAEAALRAGAGKVRIATVEVTALMIGVLMPEVAVLPLLPDRKGEIDASRVSLEGEVGKCDCLVLGPAMSCAEQASALVGMLMTAAEETSLVLDAAALMAICDHAARLKKRRAPAVLTPHLGEIAALLGEDAAAIEQDRAAAVRHCAERFGSIIVLKGAVSLVAAPTGELFSYSGGNVGLATGGSGDVMAGITAALLARGAEPLQAALWSVWLHGEAGRRCAEAIGPLGYLASELLGFIPRVMERAA